jgi:citrate synthase
MGHRIYRVRDPRAAVLETAVRPLASPRLELARAVERAAAKILAERKPDRPLAANVEFYTAVLLDAVGLPREQFARRSRRAGSPAGLRTCSSTGAWAGSSARHRATSGTVYHYETFCAPRSRNRYCTRANVSLIREQPAGDSS